MSGGTSSGRPDMLCGGPNVDPRPVGLRGENKKVNSPIIVKEAYPAPNLPPSLEDAVEKLRKERGIREPFS